jgi:predicted lipoprotein
MSYKALMTNKALVLVALLALGAVGCAPKPPATTPSSHAADANQQTLRQGKQNLARRSQSLRQRRASVPGQR